jgi:hypothetical protein
LCRLPYTPNTKSEIEGLSLGVANSAKAQTATAHNGLPSNAATEVLRLTMDQAVALALKQNTTAQIAVIQAAEAVQDRNVAECRSRNYARYQCYLYSIPFVLSAMTAGAQRDQIIGFIRAQLTAMYEMMDVKIF